MFKAMPPDVDVHNGVKQNPNPCKGTCAYRNLYARDTVLIAYHTTLYLYARIDLHILPSDRENFPAELFSEIW